MNRLDLDRIILKTLNLECASTDLVLNFASVWLHRKLLERASKRIKVDDVDAGYQAFSQLGYQTLSAPTKTQRGTYEFTLADPDDYALTFFTK